MSFALPHNDFSPSSHRQDNPNDNTEEVAEWLQCRRRFLRAAKAIIHHGSVWVSFSTQTRRAAIGTEDMNGFSQPKDMPEIVANRVHEEYAEHIECAHAWLRATLCLLEKADIDREVSADAPSTISASTLLGVQGGVLPFEVEPTPETIAVLTFTLDKNERYLQLLSKALQMMVAYVQRERELLEQGR